jgi:hypothetical protein
LCLFLNPEEEEKIVGGRRWSLEREREKQHLLSEDPALYRVVSI